MNTLRRTSTVFLLMLLVAVELRAGATFSTLCSAGERDGRPCGSFADCPGGVCVVAHAVCNDGAICDCPGARCVDQGRCPYDDAYGICSNGNLFNVRCCGVGSDCADGGRCKGTSKVCVSGEAKGSPCTFDAHCANGRCAATGYFCDGGDFDFYPCVADADCPGGMCNRSFAVTPSACVGDCDADGSVQVDEVLRLVSAALGTTSESLCLAGDADRSWTITIDEIVLAMGSALEGCQGLRVP